VEPDPRWEWIEVPELGLAEPRLHRGRCRHLEQEQVAVDALDEDGIAWLCLTCGRHFYRGSAA
jgi:hypothetical protein